MKKSFKYPDSDPIVSDIRFSDDLKKSVIEEVRIDTNPKTARPRSWQKKWGYLAAAFVIAFCAFIGSTYFSPTMANIAAKVPYFQWFTKQLENEENLSKTIDEFLSGKNVFYSSARIEDRDIEITLLKGEDQSIPDPHQIETSLEKHLQDEGFGNYHINVALGEDTAEQELAPEPSKAFTHVLEIQDKMEKYMDNNGYVLAKPIQNFESPSGLEFTVTIPTTEKRKEELVKGLTEITSEYGDNLKVVVEQVDETVQEVENRWRANGIPSILGSGLMENEDYKVDTFSFSFDSLPVKLIVRLSINSSSNAEAIANEIEDEINLFLKHDNQTKNVRNDPYEIVIYSKDKTQLN